VLFRPRERGTSLVCRGWRVQFSRTALRLRW
jgi:hypothetical protein